MSIKRIAGGMSNFSFNVTSKLSKVPQVLLAQDTCKPKIVARSEDTRENSLLEGRIENSASPGSERASEMEDQMPALFIEPFAAQVSLEKVISIEDKPNIGVAQEQMAEKVDSTIFSRHTQCNYLTAEKFKNSALHAANSRESANQRCSICGPWPL